MGNILPHLADLYLFDQLLRGNKPCCAIYSKHLANFALDLKLDVRECNYKNLSDKYYTISSKSLVKNYFQLRDVTGIVDTKLARKLYNDVKNKTPARAFKIISENIQRSCETIEAATINGMLCGYPLCDIIEYLENMLSGNTLIDYSGNFYKRIGTDYKIQHVMCTYCQKEYLKNGI